MMLPPTAPEIVNLSLYDLLGRTALIDGEPVASMGVMQQWKGVGEAWTISKPMRDNERRAIALRLRRGLDGFMKEEGLHRIQATVRADLPTPNHLARLNVVIWRVLNLTFVAPISLFALCKISLSRSVSLITRLIFTFSINVSLQLQHKIVKAIHFKIPL